MTYKNSIYLVYIKLYYLRHVRSQIGKDIYAISQLLHIGIQYDKVCTVPVWNKFQMVHFFRTALNAYLKHYFRTAHSMSVGAASLGIWLSLHGAKIYVAATAN